MALTKKEKVLQTALKMMAEGGFNDAPMSALAAKSNVAIGTIYHHFKDKEDLSKTLFQLCSDKRNKALASSLHGNGSVGDKYQNMWKAAYSYYTQNKSEHLLLEQFTQVPALKKIVSAGSKKMTTELEQFFKQSIKAGKIKNLDPAFLMATLLASASTAVYHETSGKNKKWSTKQLEELAQMSWASVKAK